MLFAKRTSSFIVRGCVAAFATATAAAAAAAAAAATVGIRALRRRYHLDLLLASARAYLATLRSHLVAES